MDEFADYLSKLDENDQKKRLVGILKWIHKEFPNLETRVAWNQPMFTDHGTFIIGFSVSKNHISVAPEGQCLDTFKSQLDQVGYTYGKQMFRIGNDQEVHKEVLKSIIEFNIKDKMEVTTFWR
ncbi:iron chaperone [Companilactobacillus ginsenosidimutans]|uniref:Iron chaperone n=1 Tax=Companilactobacillus ginsenosidimutans TaxID=1007676 RepID=A0A0H4QD47_9LACO|nr:DUF1801 domain-containing protein [Companilactobacillus ginsenosidimutans]AKP66259.1 iron chaperone [Companilactobacillus ginsenosidimutans]